MGFRQKRGPAVRRSEATRYGGRGSMSYGEFFVVRVDRDPADTHAAKTVVEALDLALPNDGSPVEIFQVQAVNAGAARLMPLNANNKIREFIAGAGLAGGFREKKT